MKQRQHARYDAQPTDNPRRGGAMTAASSMVATTRWGLFVAALIGAVAVLALAGRSRRRSRPSSTDLNVAARRRLGPDGGRPGAQAAQAGGPASADDLGESHGAGSDVIAGLPSGSASL